MNLDKTYHNSLLKVQLMEINHKLEIKAKLIKTINKMIIIKI